MTLMELQSKIDNLVSTQSKEMFNTVPEKWQSECVTFMTKVATETSFGLFPTNVRKLLIKFLIETDELFEKEINKL